MTAAPSDAPGAVGLATTPAGASARWAALAIAALSAVVLAAVAPIVDQQWAAVPAFIPAYQAAVALSDLVTAALLFGLFREHRRPALLLLGGGYVYTACLVVAHTVSFPGLFGPSVMVGGPQTTPWLWLAWHVPFPLMVAGYALLSGRSWDAPVARGGLAAFAAIVLSIGFAGGAMLLATAGHARLPALLEGNGYIPGVTRAALSVPLALSLLALAALAACTRLRGALDLWLGVVMGAWAVEILLSAVLNSGRFQAGFYVGRLYGLLASCAVLVSLLLATAALHGRLARALARERDRARAALDESNVRYRSLFDSIDAGFCVVEMAFDAAGRPADYCFLEVNPAFERQTGLPNAAGRWMRALAPAHEQRWFDIYGRVALTGEPVRFEEHAAALGRWYDVHAFRTAEPGARRVAILFNDITGRKRTEAALSASETELRRLNEGLEARVREEMTAREAVQARLAHAQRMEALGQLAGGIAHDFNNVMQAVQGGAGLIRRRASDPQTVDHLARMVEEAAERGASVTRRLLSFARRDELRAEPVDSTALLDGVHEVLEHTLGTGIAVRTELAGPLPPLLADKGQLQTVLVNLAANARDAMPGGGTLTISAEVESVEAGGASFRPGLLPGRYVRLTVADTGEGMSADVLARASEPFFTTKGVGKGTGLGLAMARGFAEQSSGALAIRSTPGAGTTVTLWLPVAEGAAPRSERDGGAGQAARARAARVLVVDDEALVREVLAEGLEERGYSTLRADGAATALAMLVAGEAVDLLLTDFAMPGVDGLALIAAARRHRPGLPAVLLTGNASGQVEARLALDGVAGGAFTLLAKPVGADQLAERIELLLERTGQA